MDEKNIEICENCQGWSEASGGEGYCDYGDITHSDSPCQQGDFRPLDYVEPITKETILLDCKHLKIGINEYECGSIGKYVQVKTSNEELAKFITKLQEDLRTANNRVASLVKERDKLKEELDYAGHSLFDCPHCKQSINMRSTVFQDIIDEYTVLREQKDSAYSERDKLVAHLTKIYPSYLAKHDPNDETWDKDWMNIVYIDSPAGQLSWHIHDSELPLFSHLVTKENNWDGHTTEEKYNRLLSIEGDKYLNILKKISEDWCHKANCHNCPAFDEDRIEFDINDWLDENGELQDEEGTFFESFKSFQHQCRRSCKRGAYLAKKALGENK